MKIDILAELKAIKQWIFDNHQHHAEGGWNDDEYICQDGDKPYVDSLELEKLIDGLIEKVEKTA